MLNRRTFYILYDALSLTTQPAHDCSTYDHGFLDCPSVESIESIREAAADMLKKGDSMKIPLDHTTECDRCGVRVYDAAIDDAYVVDDPTTATGALCPACATDDDPNHIPGSWLLTWN